MGQHMRNKCFLSLDWDAWDTGNKWSELLSAWRHLLQSGVQVGAQAGHWGLVSWGHSDDRSLLARVLKSWSSTDKEVPLTRGLNYKSYTWRTSGAHTGLEDTRSCSNLPRHLGLHKRPRGPHITIKINKCCSRDSPKSSTSTVSPPAEDKRQTMREFIHM